MRKTGASLLQDRTCSFRPCRLRTLPDLRGTEMLSKRIFKQRKASELRARTIRCTKLYESWKSRCSFLCNYGQILPCGHLAIMETPIIRTAAKSPAKLNYRHLTEIKSRYYGLSLLRTLIRGPVDVRNKGSWPYSFAQKNNGSSCKQVLTCAHNFVFMCKLRLRIAHMLLRQVLKLFNNGSLWLKLMQSRWKTSSTGRLFFKITELVLDDPEMTMTRILSSKLWMARTNLIWIIRLILLGSQCV